MDRHLTDDDLVLRYYGEMSDAVETRAAAHLDACDECRDASTRLQRVLALVDMERVPAVDATFDSRVWQQLEPTLREASGRGDTPYPSGSRLSPLLVRLSWAATAAALIVTAFVAGRMSIDPLPPAVVATAPIAVADRVLTVDLGDHLDRAELALADFLTRTDRLATPAVTEDLIAANRLYRNTATALGEQHVVIVLDELERALIEIAGSPDADGDERDAVRAWIDSRDLLFKMRIMRETLEREDSSL